MISWPCENGVKKNIMEGVKIIKSTITKFKPIFKLE